MKKNLGLKMRLVFYLDSSKEFMLPINFGISTTNQL